MSDTSERMNMMRWSGGDEMRSVRAKFRILKELRGELWRFYLRIGVIESNSKEIN